MNYSCTIYPHIQIAKNCLLIVGQFPVNIFCTISVQSVMKSEDLKGKRKTDNTWKSTSPSESLIDLYATVCPWGLMSTYAQLSQPSWQKCKCLHYYGCMSLKSLYVIRHFQSIFGKSAVSVTKIFWHCKEMHTQQNLFSGNQDESDEILFSLHVRFPASGQHYIKPCFFLMFSKFPSKQQN